jgi:tetratricopeptide (TPR) repeat protein
MAETKDWYEKAASEENEWVRAVILKPKHPAQKDALEIATNARDMAGRALGKTHPAYAEAIQNIGVYYSALGHDPNKAAENFDQARRVVGPYHPILTRSFYFLGLYYHDAGDAAKAEAFLNDALEILRHEGYEYDPRIAQVLSILADIKASSGKPSEAAELLEEVLEIQKATLEPTDADLKKTEAKLKATRAKSKMK